MEAVLHQSPSIAKNHVRSEWFEDVPLDQIRIEANHWAHFTYAAYINQWNDDAAAVLGPLKAGWVGELTDETLSSFGKGFKRARTLGDEALGSVGALPEAPRRSRTAVMVSRNAAAYSAAAAEEEADSD